MLPDTPLPLWDFALAYYAQPGVASACVQAQDQHQVNVCLLIALHWLDGRGQQLAPGQWSELQAQVAPWTQELVKPLRHLRRRLKSALGELAMGDLQEDVRERIKQAELQAERHC